MKTPVTDGYFAVGIDHTKNCYNIGTLWRSAEIFGASFIFTIGKRYKRQCSDTMNAIKRVPLFHYKTFDELYNNLPHGCLLIGVELTSESHSLPLFEHPKRACYILGAEDNGISKDVMARCHKIIQIPGIYCLNVATAGSITMYDRIQKEVIHSKEGSISG